MRGQLTTAEFRYARVLAYQPPLHLPSAPNLPMRWTVLAALWMLPLGGCAQTALVRSWKPAEINVAGMQRVAVLDFEGDHGAFVSSTLTSRLWENEFYSLVDRAEIEPVLQTAAYSDLPQPTLDSLLSSARAARLDGLILGEVVDYECTDRTTQATEFHFGRHAASPHSNPQDTEAPQPFGISRRERITREGTVTVIFRLVDVETGEVRASRKVSRHYNRTVPADSEELPSEAEILERLSEECVAEIVAMLAPHPVDCPMDLAHCEIFCRGRRRVLEGNRLAKQGDWEGAERQWERAAEENPSNDAALFNLAIAAAHRQDYSNAEAFAMQALRLRHRDCYACGLEKIRAQKSAFDETQSQRDARLVPATASVWR